MITYTCTVTCDTCGAKAFPRYSQVRNDLRQHGWEYRRVTSGASWVHLHLCPQCSVDNPKAQPHCCNASAELTEIKQAIKALANQGGVNE